MPIVIGNLMEGDSGRIRVTDRAAADGEKSLAFADGRAAQARLPHWAMYLSLDNIQMTIDNTVARKRP